MTNFEMMQSYRQVWLKERAKANLPSLQIEALAAYHRGFIDALAATFWREKPDAAPQAGQPRTAQLIGAVHPEKPAVAASTSLDYEAIWQRAKEKAKRTIELRYPADERDGRDHEEHSLAVKFYAEMSKL